MSKWSYLFSNSRLSLLQFKCNYLIPNEQAFSLTLFYLILRYTSGHEVVTNSSFGYISFMVQICSICNLFKNISNLTLYLHSIIIQRQLSVKCLHTSSVIICLIPHVALAFWQIELLLSCPLTAPINRLMEKKLDSLYKKITNKPSKYFWGRQTINQLTARDNKATTSNEAQETLQHSWLGLSQISYCWCCGLIWSETCFPGPLMWKPLIGNGTSVITPRPKSLPCSYNDSVIGHLLALMLSYCRIEHTATTV